MNSTFPFNKYKKNIIFFLWLLPEKFSDCPKNCFARFRVAAAPAARTPMQLGFLHPRKCFT